jgi:hypothetical protein
MEEKANPYSAPRSLPEVEQPADGFPRWGWRAIWAVIVFNSLVLLVLLMRWPLPEPVETVVIHWWELGIPLTTAAANTWLALWKRFTSSDLAHRRTVLALLVSIITLWGLTALGFSFVRLL